MAPKADGCFVVVFAVAAIYTVVALHGQPAAEDVCRTREYPVIDRLYSSHLKPTCVQFMRDLQLRIESQERISVNQYNMTMALERYLALTDTDTRISTKQQADMVDLFNRNLRQHNEELRAERTRKGWCGYEYRKLPDGTDALTPKDCPPLAPK